MPYPIDTATGLRAGSEVHTGMVDVLVGYLVTLPNGYECRLGPDRTRAALYAAQQHATIEMMYVRRNAAPSHQIDAGSPVGGEVMAG